ncbi:MAG: N-acetyl-gamma-glutamyl-phosphate reductase [Gemmatimonadaceae bacterium]|nr:N-acetyl-gamma-glutamyl-phosphate reductase [Gemmatimonadaceae bacterium]
MHKVAVGILGASGYTGRELCGLVARHPGMELAFAAANGQRGQRARFGASEITFLAPDDVKLDDAQMVFSALPHGASAGWVDAARQAGARVIDLSSDFRPGNSPTAAPYGLTEIMRDTLAGAELVANPGCYPTAVLIGLAPLLARGLVRAGATINVNAASGVTGAGFAPKQELMFAEVAEDFRAYAPGNVHRHLAEMNALVRELGGDADVLFTPYLLPVARGILATITVPLATGLAHPAALWRGFYAGEPFVEVVDSPPSLRDVVHRNVVRLSVHAAANVRQPTLVIVAAIDNLLKGAAGQAVQNANLLLGLDERLGLPA